MTAPTRDRPLSTADTVAMWIFIVAGLAIVGTTVYAAAARLLEGLGGGAVEVPAVFSGTVAQAPIGPAGAMRDVELQNAVLTTDGLSAAGTGALVLEQVVAVASVATVVVCLIAVSLSVMRGRAFSRRSTVLVGTAGFAALAGVVGVPFFGNMVANDAFRAISDGTFDNVVMTVDLFPLFTIAFLAAIAGTVFTVGDRLQRETEGLV